MFKRVKNTFYAAGAAFTLGTMGTSSTAQAGTNDFSTIAENMINSIASLPGLITGLSYLGGTLFGVLGILKIKDHVENPQQTQIKEGAIRLAAGGALFGLPIIYEAMFTTIGDGTTTSAAELNAVDFAVS